MLIHSISHRVLLNVFRVAPSYDDDRAPVLNDEGRHMNKLVPKFPFHWTRKHYDNGTEVYVWKKGQLGVEDQASIDFLTAFIAGIPPAQREGQGGKPVINKDGKVVYDLGLIGVKELLESEDPVA